MNYKTFNKHIFKQGDFLQFVVYPYFGNTYSGNAQIIILSDQVDEPTYLSYRKRKEALVIPYHFYTQGNLGAFFKEIQSFCRVQAPVFTFIDIDKKENTFRISEVSRKSIQTLETGQLQLAFL